MQWGVRRKVTVVDSLSLAVAHSPAEETGRFLEACRTLCQRGSTVILTLHSHYLSDDLADSVRRLCDVHLRLYGEETYRGRAASVEICKAQGSAAAPGTRVSLDPRPKREPLAAPVRRTNGRRRMAG
jgi:archaellum biogenesis ATPase FlaH